MALDRPTTIRCAHCGKKVPVARRGRMKVYCGNNCRVLAFEKNERATAIDNRHRLLTWRLLQDAGLVPADKPLPAPKLEDAAQ
jgi:phage FluMu protein Com